MRTIIILLTIFFILTLGCKKKVEDGSSNSLSIPQVIKNKDNYKNPEKKDNSKKLPPEYLEALLKVTKKFPKDSASIYRFYSRIYKKEKAQSQIQRMEKLLTDEFIYNYTLVDNHLKLLLENTVTNNTITCHQADSIAELYSFYDNCRGGSMCSQVLSGDDNYDLVWTSFRIMSKQSHKDTCYIAALINLDDHIRTNVELGQAMAEFIVESIKNNPKGFLDMYVQRNSANQNSYWRYVSVYDQPDSTLMATLNNISNNSKNESHRKSATEILDNIDKLFE